MDILVFPPGLGSYEEAPPRIFVQVFEWIYVSITLDRYRGVYVLGGMVSAQFALKKLPNTSSAYF